MPRHTEFRVTRDPASASKGMAAFLLTPLGVLYVLFLIAPISYFLAVSFLKYSATQLYTSTPTFENYGRLLFDPFYTRIILDTFRISAIVTVITAILAYAMAFQLVRVGGTLRGLMIFGAVAPLMLGVIARSYGWIVLLGQDGLVNRMLLASGLTSTPLTLLGTEGTVIVALVHFMIPYMLFPIFSSLAGQDRQLVPAAASLGARPLRAFLEVTLPLSRPGLVMGSALVFTLSAGSVVTPALLGGRHVAMLGQTIYQLVMSTFNWPLGAAAACILVLCQLAVMFLSFGRSRRAG
jgi:putative spermidine/putrescine transport system permease protein